MAPRIVEIGVTPVPVAYPKELGSNAYSEIVGRFQTEWLVRARTDAGHEGLANAARFMRRGGASVEQLLALRWTPTEIPVSSRCRPAYLRSKHP